MAIVEVLKYDGKPDTFAWKYPSQELGTWTQLIVNESQEAVFVKEGKILDILGPGKHTLITENIPILANFMKLPFGGKSPFTAEVWFINKAYAMDVKWGTPTPIQVQDPKYNVFIPVRSFGQFGIQIIDSRNFLTKLVGTLNIFDESQLTNYFRGLLISNVKDIISSYIIEKQISILEINAYITELQEALQEMLSSKLNEFGIKLVNFYITSIDTPEDDPAVIQLKQALSKKAEMDILGYDYSKERSFDTLESAAKNESSGNNLMNAGIGLGMGLGLTETFATQVKDISKNVQTKEISEKSQDKCPYCHSDINKNQKYCSSCGKKVILECPNCGEQIDERQKFCTECGTSLVKKCKKCGTELNNNSKFCPNCGEKEE